MLGFLKSIWKLVRGNVIWDAIKKGWEERSVVGIVITGTAWFLGFIRQLSWIQLVLLAITSGSIAYLFSPPLIRWRRKLFSDSDKPTSLEHNDGSQFDRIKKTSLDVLVVSPTVSQPFIPASNEQIRRREERAQKIAKLAKAMANLYYIQNAT